MTYFFLNILPDSLSRLLYFFRSGLFPDRGDNYSEVMCFHFLPRDNGNQFQETYSVRVRAPGVRQQGGRDRKGKGDNHRQPLHRRVAS